MRDGAPEAKRVDGGRPVLPKPLRGAAIAVAVLISACTVIEVLVHDRSRITAFLFLGDVPVLIALAAILVAAARLRSPAWLAGWIAAADHPRLTALSLAVVAGAAALAGTFWVFENHALSYDEVMAVFDAEIFRTGRLIAPMRLEWQGWQEALAPSFLLPVPGDVAWVSAYLPVNALLRAAVGALAAPALTGPLLLGVAVLALAGIARRLWPDRPDAAVVAALLLVTAPQVLFTAMTPYAMTAHLALNLVWLWLFLRGGLPGHAGAAAIGFLACGLHQVVFHPLFAAPFVLGLALGRRWRLLAFYTAVYAVAGIAWILYWQELLALAGYAGQGASAVGGGWFAHRVAQLLAAFRWDGLDLMAMNLLRFVAWQSPFLLPLAVLAWPAIRRGEGIARPLAAGLGLTILAMAVLLPFQGHGWGYRYLHGLVGSACLLAAQGWIAVTARSGPPRAAARAALGASFAVALLVLVPIRAVEIHRFVAPYAAAARAIAATDADIVAVTEGGVPYARDLVRNDPFLRNRPVVVLLDDLDATARTTLCARGTIAVFGPAEARRLGFIGTDPDDATSDTQPALPCAMQPVRLPRLSSSDDTPSR